MLKRLCSWVIIFFVPVLLFSEELIFRSNSIGMALEKITEFQTDNFEYILYVPADVPEGRFEKALYKNGSKYKRWVEEEADDGGKRTRFYEKGSITEETFYSMDGKIERIITYDDDSAVEEEQIYNYKNDELQYVDVVNGDGIELYRVLYKKGKFGRLRETERRYPEESMQSHYIFGPNEVAEEWHGRGEKTDHFRFGNEHQLKVQEYWRGEALVNFTEYLYDAETVNYSVSVDYLSNIVTEKWYDSDGLEVRSLSEREGVLVSESEFTYDGEGNVIEKKVWSPGLLERWEYGYKGDELQEESYYKNGTLTSNITYVNDDEYHEVLYRRGRAFIKLVFVNDVKVEEILMLESEGKNSDE